MDGDVKCKDLTEETGQTLNGEEQFVMFDTEEGKRALLSTIAEYIIEHGEIDGSNIPTLLNGKVDKEEGKGLTENDYTDSDKEKVGTLPYTGTAPITVTGSAITHDDSGATAGAYGDTANKVPDFGGTFKVPSFTVDAKGHLTVAGEHTVKIPDATATEQADGLMAASDKIQVTAIGDKAQLTTTDKSSIVAAINEVDAHADTNTGQIGNINHLTTASQANLVAAINEVDAHADNLQTQMGNRADLHTSVITNIVAAINEVADGKVNKVSGKGLSTNDYTTEEKNKLSGIEAGAQVNRTYTGVTGKPTSNSTPSFGGTVTISQIAQNNTGQITATNRTIKIPDAVATATAKGLMSAQDKTDLANLVNTSVPALQNADTAIKAMLAPTEEDGKAAHQSYSGNAFLIVDNTLYQTPDAISEGDTIDKSALAQAELGDAIVQANDRITELMLDIAPTEDGETASTSYPEGALFFRGGLLCQASMAIDQGDTLTEYTNYTTADISTVLTELWTISFMMFDNPGVIEVMNPPAEDGFYTFKCAIADGEPTYFWEPEE